MYILYLRFANSFFEPIGTAITCRASEPCWRRISGVRGCGGFYETAGGLRDVVENHLFQIVALLAMEPPAGQSYGFVQEKRPRSSGRCDRCGPRTWCAANMSVTATR